MTPVCGARVNDLNKRTMGKIDIDPIRKLAVEKYGTDPFKFGGQRDGFVEGYKKALEQMNSSNDIQNVMICRNCGSKNTYKCRVTDVIVCKDCDYQD